MKSSVNYCSLLVYSILFHKCLCQYNEVEMKLSESYTAEAYISAFGSKVMYNETKLSTSKKQTFYFSKKSVAKPRGYMLRLTTTKKLKIEHFRLNKKRFRYFEFKNIQGPMSVFFMYEVRKGASILAYFYAGAGKLAHSPQKFHVNIQAIHYVKQLRFTLLGTFTKTAEFEYLLPETVRSDAGIGEFVGVALRVEDVEHPTIHNITVTHKGKVHTFVFNSQMQGPFIMVQILDKFKDICLWSEWKEKVGKNKSVSRKRRCFKYGAASDACDKCVGDTEQFVIYKKKTTIDCLWSKWMEIRSKNNDVARNRTCFKTGGTKKTCNKCPGDSVQFIISKKTLEGASPNSRSNSTPKTQQNPVKHEGMSNSLFYGIVALLAVSILMNFASIGIAVYYRFKNQDLVEQSVREGMSDSFSDATL